jgi:cobalamin biosynthesis protein CobD/CbiB
MPSEGAVGGSSCVKAAFRLRLEQSLARLAPLHPVKVLGVGLEVVEGQFDRLARGQSDQLGLSGVVARGCAIFEVTFHWFLCQGTHRHRVVADPAQHEGQ